MKYAVLDPKVTLSLPPFITATTGMDALARAVEAYIGRSTTYGTRKDALLAVKLIFENIDTAYTDGTNVDARRNMLHASYYAGCAFTKSYVGYVHAVAHSLAVQYNITYGLANAILLPHVLEEYGETIPQKTLQTGSCRRHCGKRYLLHTSRLRFIDEIKAMKKRFGIGNLVPEIKGRRIFQNFPTMPTKKRSSLSGSVFMNAKELEKFYYMLMKEEGR